MSVHLSQLFCSFDNSLFPKPSLFEFNNCLLSNLKLSLICKDILSRLRSISSNGRTADSSVMEEEISCKLNFEDFREILGKRLINDTDKYLMLITQLFLLFIRLNWTGPTLSLSEHRKWMIFLFGENANSSENDIASISLMSHNFLCVDSEDLKFQVVFPYLLLLSEILMDYAFKHLLIGNDSNSNTNQLCYHYWYIRVLKMHQQIISNPSQTLKSKLLEHCSIVQQLFMDMETEEEDEKSRLDLLECQFHMEYCLIADFYWQHSITDEQYSIVFQSLKKMGFNYELSSKLGKKTRYQSKSISQLILIIHASLINDQNNENGIISDWYFAINRPLNDDTLLDEIAFDDKCDMDNVLSLHYLECCFLLFECHRISRVTLKGISDLEAIAYLTRLIKDNGSWAVHFMCLWKRSVLEMDDGYKLNRSIQQFEGLITHLNDFMSECNTIPKDLVEVQRNLRLYDGNQRSFEKELKYDEFLSTMAEKRMQGIFCVHEFVSKHEFESEFGDINMKMGFIHSALRIFEKIKDYEKIIRCLISLDRKFDAQKLIESQMQKLEQMNDECNNNQRMAYYLCLLGDITDDIKYYQRAWKVSNERYSRAQRSLAFHYYYKKQYSQCMKCCRLSLKINSLFPKTWFILGSSASFIEPLPIFKVMIEAFSFVVSIEPTDFEAWNNLGAAHMHLKHWKSALYALQQAGNLRRGHWKIWENILTCSLKMRALSKSISSFNHLIDINKHSTSINSRVIAVIAIEMSKIIRNVSGIKQSDADLEMEFNINTNMSINDNQKEIKEDQEENKNKSEFEVEDEQLSEHFVKSLMMQFQNLIQKILRIISGNSFQQKLKYEHESPFDNENSFPGLKSTETNTNQEHKNCITDIFHIYEIFCLYFERFFECEIVEEKNKKIKNVIDIRWKQCRLAMKYYFSDDHYSGNVNNMKEEYLKVVHVLNRLTLLYLEYFSKSEKNTKVVKNALTSIEMISKKIKKLSDNEYEEHEQCIQLHNNMDLLLQRSILKLNTIKPEESFLSAFSDWM